MSETSLTNDERRCLQLWFRQAIAEVERRETIRQLVRRDVESSQAFVAHRQAPSTHRAKRVREAGHTRQMMV